MIAEICSVVAGPVSAEVASMDFETMMAEADCLCKIAPNVVIKLPLTLDGLKACRALTSKGVKTNVTLCFSPNQALLAAKAGATYISPFLGRLDDLSLDGMELIRDIRQIYDNYDFKTEILAARSVLQPCKRSRLSPELMWQPFLQRLSNHSPITFWTDKGLDQFAKDWAATGQSIL